MTPVPYTTATAESTSSTTVDPGLCPKCGVTLVRSHRTLSCEGCGHVPNHGAD